MNGICIYGASSNKVDVKYKEAAYEMGELIAKNGFALVFGAGGHGLMGSAAEGAAQYGGEIIGIIPEKLNLPGIVSKHCTKVIVTPTMHVRKETMENSSDAFVALAGGFGTFEELLEVITLKQLGYIDVPIVILNTEGYYDSLISMFNRAVSENFANECYLDLFFVAQTPNEAMGYILSYDKATDFPDKMQEMLKH